MAEKYKFFDPVQREDGTYDREYSAQEFTDYFKTLINTGIMKAAGNQLNVTANGSNMMTTIDTGVAFILGRYYENDSLKELLHDTESLGNSRIDRVVIRMDLSTEARYVKAFIKKGVASANPVAPALTQTANFFEISLAQVKVVGGQTYINTNTVTDERGKDVICPWAGSNILPSFDDNVLASHVNDGTLHIPYVIASGLTNAYTVLIANVNQYTEGMAMSIKINIQNTGASTINVNGLGARNIIKGNGNPVSGGNLRANSVYTLRYNGMAFILQGEGGGGTATSTDVLAGRTFTNDNGEATGAMVNHGSRGTIMPTTSNQSMAAGYYNAFTIAGDANLIASNIKKGVNLFGTIGTSETKIAYTSANRTVSSGNPTMQTFTLTLNAGFSIKAYIIVINAIYFGPYIISGIGVLVDGVKSGTLQLGGMGYNNQNWLYVTNGSSISGTTLNGSITVNANYSGITSGQTISLEAIAWGF
ncbi:hypothetical protein [Lysinibacillus fusiformis]|uniref:hypothetical protein n=1 Tax=Lysinibacillus fusiformis TaxID=28031 RepID=UPI003AAFC5F7